MKRVVLFAVILGFFSTAAAPFVPSGWESDLETARRRSIKENKPILLLISGPDWCGPCRALHNNLISDRYFNKILQKYAIGLFIYVPYKNMSAKTKNDIKQTRKALPHGGVPRYAVVDSNMQKLSTPQKRTAHAFMQAVSEASVKIGGNEVDELGKLVFYKPKNTRKKYANPKVRSRRVSGYQRVVSCKTIRCSKTKSSNRSNTKNPCSLRK